MTVHEWGARDAAVSDLNVVFESERAAAAEARYLDCNIDGQPLRAKVHGRASEGTQLDQGDDWRVRPAALAGPVMLLR